MSVNSFALLAVLENPRSEDVLATLLDYAESGAAINSQVVIDLLKRVNLTEEQKQVAKHACENAVENQQDRGFPQEASQYQRVANYITL